MDWNFIIFSLVKVIVIVHVILGFVAYAVLAERKIAAWVQDRPGPNRVAPPFMKYVPILGPFLTRLGVFQPLADGLKSFLKEDFTPAGVKKVYFWLAPCIAVVPILFAAAPLGTLPAVVVVVAYEAATLLSMVALVLLAQAGATRLRWHFLEHYADVAAGGLIAVLGLVLLVLGI